MIFILGGIVGVFIFGEAYPWISSIYSATAYGDVTADSLIGITPGLLGLGVIVVAIGAFIATSWVEGKVNPDGPAHAFPTRRHQLVAAGVLVLGVILAIVPPYQTRMNRLAESEQYQNSHPVERMTVDELAFRVMDKDPSLLVIDVRSPEAFQKQGLPGAFNVARDELFGKQWEDVFDSHKQKVFVAASEEEAVQAATLASLLGIEKAEALEGGWQGFTSTILDAKSIEQVAKKGDKDTYRFRQRAATQIARMIAERGKVEPVKKKVKKVVGGCGI